MTPDEAIKELRLSKTGIIEAGTEATQLGIEALERCSHNYLNPQCADFRRLPSETEGDK